MKTALGLFALLTLLLVTGCTSGELGASDNPHPRRHFDANSGNFVGPVPLKSGN